MRKTENKWNKTFFLEEFKEIKYQRNEEVEGKKIKRIKHREI